MIARFLIAGFFLLGGSGAKMSSLDRLMEGNKRYVNDKTIVRKGAGKETLVGGQNPIAIVVGCADSRVPPEIVFDQYLGDLFVVRVAGNVVGPLELDSIEYAIKELSVPLIFVLGHQSCGAVTAVLNGKAEEDDIENIAPYIQPAVDETKNLPGDYLENAIKANVQLVIQGLRENPTLKQVKTLEIRGGYYHLGTGAVEILPKNS